MPLLLKCSELLVVLSLRAAANRKCSWGRSVRVVSCRGKAALARLSRTSAARTRLSLRFWWPSPPLHTMVTSWFFNLWAFFASVSSVSMTERYLCPPDMKASRWMISGYELFFE